MHFKDFFLIFLVRVPPYVKNWPKYFFIETWQFKHHSKALVEFRRFLLLLKSFRVFWVEKYSKIVKKYEFLTFFTKSSKSGKTSFLYQKLWCWIRKRSFFARWTWYDHKKDDFKLKFKNSKKRFFLKKKHSFFSCQNIFLPK
jgi:hypothetical protein